MLNRKSPFHWVYFTSGYIVLWCSCIFTFGDCHRHGCINKNLTQYENLKIFHFLIMQSPSQGREEN